MPDVFLYLEVVSLYISCQREIIVPPTWRLKFQTMVADKFLCCFLIAQRKWIFQPAKIKYNYCRNRNASGSFNRKHGVRSCLVIAPVIIFSKINYNNITFLKTDSPLNMHSVETSGDADGNVCAECWEETFRARICRLWEADAGPGRQREKSQAFN